MMSTNQELTFRPFSLGQIVMTQGFAALFDDEMVAQAAAVELIARHATGDFGHLCKEDWLTNLQGLNDEEGGRIMSTYKLDGSEEDVWVITEYDRSVTTVLLPSEY
jgi:hypothetical protein